MTTIYLIRHAEAEGNLYRRIHGWYDALITDNGFRQIAALQERFRDIPVDAVYSSDLYRTQTTARAIYLPQNLPLHTDSRLREVHMGDWEDKPWGEVYRTQPEAIGLFNRSDPTWRAPHGDSLGDLGIRVEQAITDIAAAHPQQTVAIFCHGTAIRQFLANVEGVAPADWCTLPHFDNTAVTALTYDDHAFTVQFRGDASHLPPQLSTLGRQNWWRTGDKKADINLWYRPIQWPQERELYRSARQEAWTSIHGDTIPFQADSFLLSAQEHLSQSPWGITVAMAGDEIAGLLQLDTQRYAQNGVGYIAFCYIMPAFRGRRLGIQLIGQAVSFFRPQGRDKLRLRCAPYNEVAQHFYRSHGFQKIGEEPDSRVPLDILEKYIGYHQ